MLQFLNTFRVEVFDELWKIAQGKASVQDRTKFFMFGSKKEPIPIAFRCKTGVFSNGETSAIKILTKAENDAELEKMWSMAPQQTATIATVVMSWWEGVFVS